MNKLTCMAGLGIALATSSAFAADLPSRRAPPIFVAPIAAGYSWTGLEFGLTTSGTFPSSQSVQTTAFGGAFLPPTGISLNKGGLDKVGAGVAANYQFTPGTGFVVGAQADISYFNLHAYEDLFVNAGKFNFQQRLAYLGTANGRIGYAFDRLLIYATGGFAYGEVHTSTFVDLPGARYFGTNNGSVRTGYNAGGGVEYAIPSDSILNKLSIEKLLGIDKTLGLDIFEGTIRAEAVHYDLGSQTLAINSVNGAPGGYTSTFRTQGNLVRVGLGYKFNGFGGAAPVVARY